MKKILVMKILAGAASAAFIVPCAVNIATNEANVNITTENGAYVAEANAECFEVDYNELAVAETGEAEVVEEKAETVEAFESEETSVVPVASKVVEDVVVEKTETVAEKPAETAKPAKTVEPKTEKTKTAKTETTVPVQTAQLAKTVESKTEKTETAKTETTVPAQTAKPAQVAQPAQVAVVDDEEADVYTASYESVFVLEFATEEESAPEATPQPVYVKVPHYYCNCGYDTCNYDDLGTHLLQHVLNGCPGSYNTVYDEVLQ